MDRKPRKQTRGRQFSNITNVRNEDSVESVQSPRPSAKYLVEFPTSQGPRDRSRTQADCSTSNRHTSLATTYPDSKENGEPTPKVLSRSGLDRRTSLPAFGIDPGRSEPSYGHTLKRSTVAIYGLATELFSSSTEAPVVGTRARTSSGKSPLGMDHAIPEYQSTTFNPSHLDSDFRTTTEEPEDWVQFPKSVSTHTLKPKTRNSSMHNNQDKVIFPLSRTPQPGVASSSRPPTLSRSQTIGFSTDARCERPSNARGANVNLKSHFRLKKAENARTCITSSPPTDESLAIDPENEEDFKRAVGSPRCVQESYEDTIRRARKKRLIIRELIETERRYVAVLQKINDNYLKPIQQSQGREDSALNSHSSRYSITYSRVPSLASPIVPAPPGPSNASTSKEILPVSITAEIFSNFGAIFILAREFLSILEAIAIKANLFDTDLDAIPSLIPGEEDDHRKKTAEQDAKILATADELMVGKTLSPLWEFFKLYTVFTANFSLSQSKLHIHSKKPSPSPQFAKLLSDCSRRGIDNGLGFPHMLLEIIQRVPRYELLIKDLIKNSSERFDPDYHHLISSSETLSFVARKLETAMKDQEERTKTLEIQRSMEGLNFSLVTPTRKLVKVGLLLKLDRKGDRRNRMFFLFNDCLIYAGLLSYYSQESLEGWIKWLGIRSTASTSSNSYQYMNPLQSSARNYSGLFSNLGYSEDNRARLIFCLKMDLNDLNVVGTGYGTEDADRAFQILSSTKSFVVYAESSDVKEEWIKALRQAKNDMLDNRGTLFITEENRPSDFQRRPRLSHPHVQTSSPPLRVVSWVSFASSDGTGSSAPADGSDLGFSSPINRGQGFNDLKDTERTIYQTRNPTNLSRLTSPSTQNLKSSVISLLNLKALVNRSIFTSSSSQNIQNDFERTGSKPQELENPSRPQSTFDESFHFVAQNYSAPVWVPDNKASRCMACQERFSLLRRRHHCRLCGCVFCALCSSRTFVIMSREGNDRYARACEACFKSVFLIPQSLATVDQEANSAKYLSPTPNRPHDDLDLTFREQRQRQAFACHRHRQSLPIELDSIVKDQLRKISTDPRLSLFSSTTVEEDVVSPASKKTNPPVLETTQIASNSNCADGAKTMAGRELSRLLEK
ncbi:uncharacterized protein MELLADRAFT_110413 [Melampsora larici-populina 98AG31]|uniref:Uncharacterized protein n=1 Tax=Melampsora larici-populina (strain 98AG31 / pathotype 3-4-7) TaxID=747676 RepID=F4RZR0_MELLP|nr:uncharacterized protein MELLADRAFT_110413 [Melampsora larici-populina 98AG31]EGG02144.1 hypothetical protein MELLADRAFT_110413 [Melampsora larici-populina 98AG31]